MAVHFTLPKQQLLDRIGRPYPGAKAYFYNAGTMTLRNVYQDTGLSLAHASPVVADSNGVFPVIYLPPGAYKVKFLDSANALIYEADDLDPSIASSVNSVPISGGGTGATTAPQALVNLGAASDAALTALSNDVDARLAPALMVGEVRMLGFSTVPSKWLECNGAAVSRVTYLTLFNTIGTAFGVGDGSTTFNIPNMRGEFARGWDNGRGVDTGRVIGSAQSEMIGPHTHPVDARIVAEGSGAGITIATTGAPTTTMPTDDNSGTENRPRNIALMFIIYAGV